jgi:hypothetical protein
VQFRRAARGANGFSYLTPMPAAYTQRAMARVSQAAPLVGLEAPKASLNLEVKPYALGVEPGIAFNWVDLAEGSFVAKLLTARATYNLSPRKALMALVQYNSAGDLIGANVRFG